MDENVHQTLMKFQDRHLLSLSYFPSKSQSSFNMDVKMKMKVKLTMQIIPARSFLSQSFFRNNISFMTEKFSILKINIISL